MLRIASISIAGLLFAVTNSMAAVILTSPSVEYQMSSQSPCVIGGSQCNSVEPAGFPFTLLPTGGGTQDYTASSPIYTVGQIEAILGSSTFLVGIDVNSTEGNAITPATEELVLFQMYIGGVLIDQYSDPNGSALYIPRNGTGWSDATLTSTLFDLSGYADGVTVEFRTIITNATDGRENIFLINTTTPPCDPREGGCDVIPGPEPASLALLGTGLFVAGIRRFRRRRNS